MLQMIKDYIRRSPPLYSLIHRLRFILSPPRLIGQVLRQPALWRHRLNSKVLAGPRTMGFAGGVYNPGAISIPDGRVILMAKGQVCHWYDAVGVNVELYYKGAPVVLVLDRELNSLSQHVVSELQGFQEIGQVGYEDFRLFLRGGDIWVNHSMIPIVRRHPSVSTFQEAKTCLSCFDSTHARLTFKGHPQIDFPISRIEKNWMYVEHDGILYLFYSFNPYRVLRLVEQQSLSFATVIHQSLPTSIADIGGFGTMVSLSTNPIDYDECHWLMLVHQVERNRVERCYHHWGVLIDKESLLPRRISSHPLFSGTGARGRKAGILYVTSAIRVQGDFVFFIGEGDEYVTSVSISKTALEQQWEDMSAYKPKSHAIHADLRHQSGARSRTATVH